MTIAFTEYLTDVLPSVPGCPRTVAVNAVRRAAKRLCQDTLLWRETLTAIDVVAEDDDYTLTPVTADTLITAIWSAEFDEVPISVLSEKELDETDYNWRNAGLGSPQACFLQSPTVIKLNRKPLDSITGGLVVRVALMPDDDAAGADDVLYTHYREAIVHGALHYVMQIPEQTWTNFELSIFHGKHFDFQIQNARTLADRNRARKPSRAKMIKVTR